MSLALCVSLALSVLPSAGAHTWRRPPELKVKAPPALTRWAEVEKLAFQYLGRPYEMGGVGSPAFDCSGFVCRVYAEAGYALPRVSRDQARAGQEVPLSGLQPGDMLFFGERGGPVSHVGIYLGKDELIHASTSEGEIVVASLKARWFQDHLLGARRVLSTDPNYVYQPPPVTELEEHAGAFSLPITLRRPPERPLPGLGPERLHPRATAARVDAAWATQGGEGAPTLVPVLSLSLRSWALYTELGLPIRWDPRAHVGALNTPAELSRMLQLVQLGLPNADLFLRLSRAGDLSLGAGLLVRHLIPSSAGEGLPGYSLARTPLSFAGQLRRGALTLGAVVDDVVAPGVAGASVAVKRDGLRFGVEGALDRGRLPEGRAALSGLAAELGYSFIQTRRWSLVLSARGARLGQSSEAGFGAEGRLFVQRRLSGARAISVEAFGGALGARYLDALLGPTYAVHRAAQLEALAGLGGRGFLGGRLSLELGRLVLSAEGAGGLGEAADPLDDRLAAVLELRRLRGLLSVPIDLRVSYAARRVFSPHSALQHVMQAGLRIRVSRWFSTEAQFMRAEGSEYGLGLTASWVF